MHLTARCSTTSASPSYGVTYELAGGAAKTIELGHDVPAKEKRPVQLHGETRGDRREADDLVSWYVWADDIGPDGQVRRTKGDLFFARCGRSMKCFARARACSHRISTTAAGGGGQNPARKLTELQKQIINATWRLQRDGQTPHYADDVKARHRFAGAALAQAGEAKDKAESVREQTLWTAATTQMERRWRNQGTPESPAPLGSRDGRQRGISRVVEIAGRAKRKSARQPQPARGWRGRWR